MPLLAGGAPNLDLTGLDGDAGTLTHVAVGHAALPPPASLGSFRRGHDAYLPLVQPCSPADTSRLIVGHHSSYPRLQLLSSVRSCSELTSRIRAKFVGQQQHCMVVAVLAADCEFTSLHRPNFTPSTSDIVKIPFRARHAIPRPLRLLSFVRIYTPQPPQTRLHPPPSFPLTLTPPARCRAHRRSPVQTRL